MQAGLTDGAWTLLVVFCTVAGIVLGSVATFFVIEKRRPRDAKDGEYDPLNA